MKRIVILLLILCFLISGCSPRLLEDELLVIVLAVDEDLDGLMTVGVKVPSSGKKDEEDDQGDYVILQAQGHSFPDALALLNATTPRKLNFSQVREIVIGERAAASESFSDLLFAIDTVPRFRCSASVIVCKENALSFIRAQKPIVGIRLSRYADETVANSSNKGYTPSTNLCEGVRDLGCGKQDPLFILGAVNEFAIDTDPAGNTLNTEAGNVNRRSKEKAELFGAAATDGKQVTGYISGYETALLHLMDGPVEALVLENDSGEFYQVYAQGKAKLTVDLSARPIRLSVSLHCKIPRPSGVYLDPKEAESRLSQDILKALRHLQLLHCDGAGFGQIAARKFLTVEEWENLNFHALYEAAEISVFVHSSILDS